MEKEEIQEYINKLKQLEQELSSTDDEDIEDENGFVNELDNVLTSLSKDIQKSYGPQTLSLPVKIKKLNPAAVIPKYSKPGDAGMDLTAIEVEFTDDYVAYKTGLAFEIPTGYVGLLFPRSSNSKKDLLLTNSVGVIDSGYRGEIELRYKTILNNKIENISIYSPGDRIGQILILPYPQIEFIESETLSNSERGVGGFGSTN